MNEILIRIPPTLAWTRLELAMTLMGFQLSSKVHSEGSRTIYTAEPLQDNRQALPPSAHCTACAEEGNVTRAQTVEGRRFLCAAHWLESREGRR